MGFQSSMTFFHAGLLVIACMASGSLAIRVDWNTNHGPIVPPTSTPAPVPQPPFREPAPVWEDLSHDTKNPNPYQYVPPPPSRPRYNPDYTRQSQTALHPTVISPSTTTTFGTTTTLQASAPTQSTYSSTSTQTAATTSTAQPVPTYGTIISRGAADATGQSQSVSSLAVKFVPNVGKQYVAVVPSGQQQQQPQQKYYLAGNEVYDKYNGKYNAKLKKYKAYEQKAKMVPYVMYYQPKQQFVYYNNFGAKSALPYKHQWAPNQI